MPRVAGQDVQVAVDHAGGGRQGGLAHLLVVIKDGELVVGDANDDLGGLVQRQGRRRIHAHVPSPRLPGTNMELGRPRVHEDRRQALALLAAVAPLGDVQEVGPALPGGVGGHLQGDLVVLVPGDAGEGLLAELLGAADDDVLRHIPVPHSKQALAALPHKVAAESVMPTGRAAGGRRLQLRLHLRAPAELLVDPADIVLEVHG
mmetsp:Transcript_25751/g.66332  ORF Transcript_25751/g.66332 Transcript_25751/m.66332 type:complete len:204 (-) Transcript_25751:421-1032(-)